MRTTRRQFIARSAIGGAGLFAAPLLAGESARAGAMVAQPAMIATISRYSRLSPLDGSRIEAAAWLEADLGASRAIDAIRLHSVKPGDGSACRRPVRFRIHGSDSPAFDDAVPIADWQAAGHADPCNFIARFPPASVRARHLRIEATPDGTTADGLRLAAIEILSGGTILTVTVRETCSLHCPFPHRVG
ncbi:hypothetical protein [Sphingomonas colocasiae]|uniref:Twin-arginine translocation signal domain-containing protein n=1 Tax=Sphingomonas colocasiae TaxID=1848973 RepID=A0ABS7PQU2_9SPHN|nr:hypothetical protein [Sphingomonas colocasiae]MBY8823707.1 hypothetical protein [Sphingomonas colocasiae]